MAYNVVNSIISNYIDLQQSLNTEKSKSDKAILEKGIHSKDAIELLEKQIERHKQDIVDYVTSEHFEYALYNLNL